MYAEIYEKIFGFFNNGPKFKCEGQFWQYIFLGSYLWSNQEVYSIKHLQTEVSAQIYCIWWSLLDVSGFQFRSRYSAIELSSPPRGTCGIGENPNVRASFSSISFLGSCLWSNQEVYSIKHLQTKVSAQIYCIWWSLLDVSDFFSWSDKKNLKNQKILKKSSFLGKF